MPCIPSWAGRWRSRSSVWDGSVSSPERALLVRVVALAAGLAVIGAATELALVRHTSRAERSGRARLRSAGASLLLLGGLAIAGLLLATRD